MKSDRKDARWIIVLTRHRLFDQPIAFKTSWIFPADGCSLKIHLTDSIERGTYIETVDPQDPILVKFSKERYNDVRWNRLYIRLTFTQKNRKKLIFDIEMSKFKLSLRDILLMRHSHEYDNLVWKEFNIG